MLNIKELIVSIPYFDRSLARSNQPTFPLPRKTPNEPMQQKSPKEVSIKMMLFAYHAWVIVQVHTAYVCTTPPLAQHAECLARRPRLDRIEMQISHHTHSVTRTSLHLLGTWMSTWYTVSQVTSSRVDCSHPSTFSLEPSQPTIGFWCSGTSRTPL